MTRALAVAVVLYGILRSAELVLTSQSADTVLSIFLIAEVVKFLGSLLMYFLCQRRNEVEVGDFKMVKYGEVPTDSNIDSPGGGEGMHDIDIHDDQVEVSTQPSTIVGLLRSSLSFYCLPALLSYGADAILFSGTLRIRTAKLQRVSSFIQVMTIALVAAVMKPVSQMKNQLEWAAVILLLVSVPILLAGACSREGSLDNSLAGFMMLSAICSSLYVCVLEYMFTSTSTAKRGVHLQNIVLFGLRALFFLASLPVGDVGESTYFHWDLDSMKLLFLLICDGLLRPQVVSMGGSIMYTLAMVVSTAAFAATNIVDLMWGCGVCVTLVAAFIIVREYRLRQIMEATSRGNSGLEDDNLP